MTDDDEGTFIVDDDGDILCDELESSTVYINKTIDVVVAEPNSGAASDDSNEIDEQAYTAGEDEIAVASIEGVESEIGQDSISDNGSSETTNAAESTSAEGVNKATNVDGMNVVTFSRKKAKAAQETSSS